MKIIITIIGLILILFSVSMVMAATEGGLYIQVPTPVVKGIPFNLNLEIKTTFQDGVAVKAGSADLYLIGVSGMQSNLPSNRVTNDNYFLRRITPERNGYVSGSLTVWNFYLPTTLLPEEVTGNFKQECEATLENKILTTLKVTLPDTERTEQYTFSINPDNTRITKCGGDNLVWVADPKTIRPTDSICGDGVVDTRAGYNEKCDDGNTNDEDGCAADCKYVELGWTCVNTNFGDRYDPTKPCTRMSATDLFLAKAKSILNKQCYPEVILSQLPHPQVKYCQNGLSLISTPVDQITALSGALGCYFNPNSISC